MLGTEVELSEIAEIWGEATGSDRHNERLLHPEKHFRHFYAAHVHGEVLGFVAIEQKRPGISHIRHFLTVDDPREAETEARLLRTVLDARAADPDVGAIYARVGPEQAGPFLDAGFRRESDPDARGRIVLVLPALPQDRGTDHSPET